ncbi:MAG: hypothetical protein JWN41_943 [Thermoleophilia bacterium]|nr:hypothetical protein [Thermoleophilia bacterium]
MRLAHSSRAADILTCLSHASGRTVALAYVIASVGGVAPTRRHGPIKAPQVRCTCLFTEITFRRTVMTGTHAPPWNTLASLGFSTP